MKVLLSCFACAPNRGSEPGVGWNWAVALSKLNEVTVITREENRAEIENYREKNSIPFTVNYFGIDWFERHRNIPFQKNIYTAMWQKAVVDYAKELHKNQQFDICHHITYASFKYPTRLYSLGIPVIVGPVGGGEKTPQSCRWTYSKKQKVVEEVHDLQIWLTRKSLAFNKMCREASEIFLTTNETFACMPQKIKNKCSVMQTIGIDSSEIVKYGYPKINGEEPVEFLYVGNILAIKGIRLLVDIAYRLNDQNVIFGIVGDGPELAKMKELIKNKGIDEHFRFYGKLERSDVLIRLDSTQAFIFPSLHDSGAMVILEAMARRVPVVALATGGPGVHVTKERGYRISPDQEYDGIINDFVKAVNSIANAYMSDNLEEVHKKVDAATLYLQDECTWEGKALIMQNVYEKYA